MNFVGGQRQAPESFVGTEPVTPFRSYFPVRYYLNDFEFAVTFDPRSDPASRVVKGFPIDGIREGKYGRDKVPEMKSGLPYCPFRADIWQLGLMFFMKMGARTWNSRLLYAPTNGAFIQHLGHLSRSFVDLLTLMCSLEPQDRPTASVALARIRSIRSDLSPEILSAKGSDLPQFLNLRYIDPDDVSPSRCPIPMSSIADGSLSTFVPSTSHPLSKGI